jgi:hypothetical protein
MFSVYDGTFELWVESLSDAEVSVVNPGVGCHGGGDLLGSAC